jgi:hypothetical protein
MTVWVTFAPADAAAAGEAVQQFEGGAVERPERLLLNPVGDHPLSLTALWFHADRPVHAGRCIALQPWETPPIRIRDIEAALHAADDARRVRDAARLLQRMQALNISRYEPNPLRAIAEAEQRQTAK